MKLGQSYRYSNSFTQSVTSLAGGLSTGFSLDYPFFGSGYFMIRNCNMFCNFSDSSATANYQFQDGARLTLQLGSGVNIPFTPQYWGQVPLLCNTGTNIDYLLRYDSGFDPIGIIQFSILLQGATILRQTGVTPAVGDAATVIVDIEYSAVEF